MSSAHRPTFNPTLGGFTIRDTGAVPTRQVSSRDQPAHGTLKQRRDIQADKLQKWKLRDSLEERERKALKDKRLDTVFDSTELKQDEEKRQQLLKEAGVTADEDADISSGSENGSTSLRNGNSTEESFSGESSNDSDDEEEELMRELERIRRERQVEKEKDLERQLALEEEKVAAFQTNPLLNHPSLDHNAKRKWDDDVVFKNQARSLERPTKRFINDMIRNDFHKKFMNRYIK